MHFAQNRLQGLEEALKNFSQHVSETLRKWQETIQSQDGNIKSIISQQERLTNEVIAAARDCAVKTSCRF